MANALILMPVTLPSDHSILAAWWTAIVGTQFSMPQESGCAAHRTKDRVRTAFARL